MALQICRLQAVDRIFIMYVAGVVALSCLWTSLDLVDPPAELWVVDRISIMYVAGGVDLRVVGCGQNIYHASLSVAGGVDLCGPVGCELWTAEYLSYM